jgi:hypothetical protein
MNAYELATDPHFRELSNYITPPRAGKITALEGNGQVRVDTDDPDGGDVLAWPLNGFAYAVDDVVYVLFGVNSPDSAIVLGSKGATPTLSSYIRRSGVDTLTANWDIGEDRRILTEALRARDGEGLRLEDDAGNLGLFVEDGGLVGIGTTDPVQSLHLARDGINSGVIMERTGAYSGVDQVGIFQGRYAGDSVAQMVVRRDGANDAAAVEFQTQPAGGALTTRLIVDSVGNVAIGNFAAQGKLHLHDGVGGMLFVSKTAVAATAVTLIANGTGDVTAGLRFQGVVVTSGGDVDQPSGSMGVGDDVAIYEDGSDTLHLRVNANGSVDVRRTGGSLTYTVVLFLVWA